MFRKCLPSKALSGRPLDADKAVTPKAAPYTRALLIGINYFGTSSELSGCINDVNHVYRWLTKDCAYDPANIRVLTDEKHSADKPTKHNILEAIEWFTSSLPDEGDVKLFIHYSGHGSWERDRDGDETDGRDESICPVDYQRSGMITDDVLRRVLIDRIADRENVKLTCLFDCCHSGTVLDLRYEYEVAAANAKRRSFRIHHNKQVAKTKAHVLLLSGSLDKQYSADAWIGGKAQGAMTWGFLNVLRKFGGGKRRVTHQKLLSQLQQLLKKNGYEQIPHMCGGNMIPLKEPFTV